MKNILSIRTLVVCVALAAAAAGCRQPSSGPASEAFVLKYTGVKEDMEEVINARLAAVVDEKGEPVYRFSHGAVTAPANPSGGRARQSVGRAENLRAKWGSKFCRVNGALVEFRPVAFPQYPGADDIFMLALSTQTRDSTPAIDLFFVDLYWFQTFNASWLMPFEGPEWAPSHFKHDFMEACQLTGPDGRRRVYAIPFSAKGNMLFYRKDFLELFGLQPPETWDALRYAVQTVRETVGSPNYPANVEALLTHQYPELKANRARLTLEVERWKERFKRLRYGLLLHSRNLHNDFYPIVWGYGGDIFTNDETRQQRAVQALRDIKAMFYDDTAYPIRMAPPLSAFLGPRPTDGRAQFDPLEPFAEGEALFMINWDNRLDRMLRYDKRAIQIESIAVCPIPHMPDCESASNIGSWGWVVNGQTVSRPDGPPDGLAGSALARKAVARFLHDLTSEQAQEWLAEYFGYVPSREIRLPERVLANLQRTNPSVITLFQFFRSRGKVRFMNRPGSKRLNDILEQALHKALREPPHKDPVAEMNYLSRILSAARQQAGYL